MFCIGQAFHSTQNEIWFCFYIAESAFVIQDGVGMTRIHKAQLARAESEYSQPAGDEQIAFISLAELVVCGLENFFWRKALLWSGGKGSWFRCL